MTAYYNEIDPVAAQWLRNLISAGHIAPGDVDERSVEDVRPTELMGYTQCHFFAGVGIWSYALRQAGWSDDQPIWTGSCPCQPFSAAGKGNGFDDERHLWPAFHHLIEQCKPSIVLGEQVASKKADPWIDLVQLDLEALGYSFGCLAFPAAGVGAPHLRDRAYWVGHTSSKGLERYTMHDSIAGGQGTARPVATASVFGGLADALSNDCGREAEPANHDRTQADRPADRTSGCGGASSGAADTDTDGREQGDGVRPICQEHDAEHGGSSSIERPGPVNGHWRNADWLLCRDGKWRPVEHGTFPLAPSAPGRVGRLRAYGNGLNAKAAKTFIEIVMEAICTKYT